MSPSWRLRTTDLVVVGAALAVGSTLADLPGAWSFRLLTLALWTAGLTVTGNHRSTAVGSLSGTAGKLLIDCAILTVAWYVAAVAISQGPDPVAAAVFSLLAYVGLIAVRVSSFSSAPAKTSRVRAWLGRYGYSASPAEELRWLCLGAAALAVIHPYLSPNLIGTFDAKLYSEAMQDFLGQIHAGIFPVYVSQTEIAPFGAVFPFRMASYHFYFGALIDLATFRSLSPYTVQHLTVVLSAIGGIGSMYAVLRSLAPARRWEAAALAFLYLNSPAWLGALYAKDMYFTFMTLPWIPVVAWASVRTFRSGDRGNFAILGIGVALVWVAHPPVGFWVSAAAGLLQLARLAMRRPTVAEVSHLGIAAGICLLLCAGLFVSLADVQIAGEYLDPAAGVLTNLHQVAPAIFRPVSAGADQLSDFQLGYALQAVLIFALVRRSGADARIQWSVAGLCAALLVLLYPVPGVTNRLWQWMPWAVTNITNVWPMQRILPVVAAFVPVAGILALGASKFPRAAGAGLALACAWSGAEAVKFVRRGHAVTKAAEATRLASRPENSPLLPNWTAYTPKLPDLPLVSRVTDPRLLNNLFERDNPQAMAVFNPLAGGVTGPTTPVNAVTWDPGVLRLYPDLRLEPGRRYELILNRGATTAPGILQVLTLDVHPRFYQEVEIAIVPGKTNLAVLSLWTSGPEPLDVAMLFRPRDPAYATSSHPEFATSTLRPYTDERNGVRITSLAPYRATVDAGAKQGLLETHRFFARGYRATVNGRNVSVTESPRHLVLIPVEAGRNDVRLDYVGPPLVRAAFWLSTAAWLALVGWGSVLAASRLRAAR